MNPSRIIGAGLSGLIAAHAWPSVPVVEASPALRPHQALLRFRSDLVSHLTGVPFRKVLVRKGLWSDGGFQSPNISLANAYSKKVLGSIVGDRSIWNLEPVERWIAPEDFQEQLLRNVASRVTFNYKDNFVTEPVISTAPMPIALEACRIDFPSSMKFSRAAINVERYYVPDCDAHQTIYFPDSNLDIYRISITGNVLIIESVIREISGGSDDEELVELLHSVFRIDLDRCVPMGVVRQEYGKIVDLPNDLRKALMFKLTHEHGIYSLGRFAQWRNILLDDVVKDISVIKKLLRSDSYELNMART